MHNHGKKKVLFVSGIDFKEKSIQVIRKTPEAYIKHGWEVHYIVGRDYSKNGDYFYESIINPTDVNVYRFPTPLGFLDSMWNNPIWKAFAFRIRNFFLTLALAYKAIKLIRTVDFDVLYGYELYGTLALRLTRWLRFGKGKKFVIRFQGVYAGEWKRKGQWYRGILNWEYYLGLKTKADLCIMTNDGTKGTELLQKLNNKTPKILFYVNGVDEVHLDNATVEKIKRTYFSENVHHFISVSRLVPQKRVDRSIRIINAIVKCTSLQNVKYTIVGSGAEQDHLIKLIADLGLESYISLVGSVKNSDVQNFMACADFFLSMDTISNVGNPLLEAIRNNKLIITLNNGDTGSWIQHQHNGLIYDLPSIDLNDSDYKRIAKDIESIVQDREQFHRLKENLRNTAANKLWTWQQRMNEEVKNVTNLLTR